MRTIAILTLLAFLQTMVYAQDVSSIITAIPANASTSTFSTGSSITNNLTISTISSLIVYTIAYNGTTRLSTFIANATASATSTMLVITSTLASLPSSTSILSEVPAQSLNASRYIGIGVGIGLSVSFLIGSAIALFLAYRSRAQPRSQPSEPSDTVVNKECEVEKPKVKCKCQEVDRSVGLPELYSDVPELRHELPANELPSEIPNRIRMFLFKRKPVMSIIQGT